MELHLQTRPLPFTHCNLFFVNVTEIWLNYQLYYVHTFAQTQSEVPQKRRRQPTNMSDREIQRRLRRAAAARQHGHPEPKNNKIPADAAVRLHDGGGESVIEDCGINDDARPTGTVPLTLLHNYQVSQISFAPDNSDADSKPGFPDGLERESFDRVLLDAPCSALGLRPRLLVETRLRELEEGARYQRLMMREAAHVLAVGGHMVYSTCTMDPAENEANVRWFLDRYPQLKLMPQVPKMGGPGLVGEACVPYSSGKMRIEQWLTQEEAGLVQRFDTTTGLDAIAFFIAKFEKIAEITEDDALEPVPDVLGRLQD